MARAVIHSEQWPDCGYVEIQHPKARYRIIDYEPLMELVGVSCLEDLQRTCREQAEAAIEQKQLGRQSHWSESIAVGSSAYVEALKKQLGPRAKGRNILAVEGAHQLRETEAAYQDIFEEEKGRLRLENRQLWDLSFKH